MRTSQGSVTSTLDVESILKAIGVEQVRVKRDEVFGRCPGHYDNIGRMDRNANNWSVNVLSGRHHCFSCGYSGNIVSLVIDLTDMDMWEAMRWLRTEGYVELSAIYREELALAEDAEYGEYEPIVFAPTVVEQWALYVDPPRKALDSRHISLNAARHYDIRWKDNGWCVPIRSWRGEFLGYQWKSGPIVRNEPEFMEKSSTLFGIELFPPGDTAILVESPLDVVRLWECGYEGGLASFGVEVSVAQLDLLRQFTDSILIAMDRDAAGTAQSYKLWETLRWTVPKLRFLDYSQTAKVDGVRPKDIGEMTEHDVHASIRHARTATEARRIGLLMEHKKPKKRYRAQRRRSA
jgi:hypothetical protein